MYKKIIIFLNQMIFSSIDITCLHQRLAKFINRKKNGATYVGCACQFNKFLLINHNTRVVLLRGLTNWLPRGK